MQPSLHHQWYPLFPPMQQMCPSLQQLAGQQFGSPVNLPMMNMAYAMQSPMEWMNMAYGPPAFEVSNPFLIRELKDGDEGEGRVSRTHEGEFKNKKPCMCKCEVQPKPKSSHGRSTEKKESVPWEDEVDDEEHISYVASGEVSHMENNVDVGLSKNKMSCRQAKASCIGGLALNNNVPKEPLQKKEKKTETKSDDELNVTSGEVSHMENNVDVGLSKNKMSCRQAKASCIGGLALNNNVLKEPLQKKEKKTESKSDDDSNVTSGEVSHKENNVDVGPSTNKISFLVAKEKFLGGLALNNDGPKEPLQKKKTKTKSGDDSNVTSGKKSHNENDDGYPKNKLSTLQIEASQKRVTRSCRLRGGTLSPEYEEALKELNTVPDSMKVSNKTELNELQAEAVKLLEIIKSEKVMAHLKNVNNGSIFRNRDMMNDGGLGPFTLFPDQREQLLDVVYSFQKLNGTSFVYEVLCPEAIIYAYQIEMECDRDMALEIFSSRSAKVELPN